MTKWIDFKYNSDFETFFIYYISLFSYLNNFFPVIFIFFFKDIFPGMSCTVIENIDESKTNCLVEAENFFILYIIITLIIQLIKIVYNLIKIKNNQLI